MKYISRSHFKNPCHKQILPTATGNSVSWLIPFLATRVKTSTLSTPKFSLMAVTHRRGAKVLSVLLVGFTGVHLFSLPKKMEKRSSIKPRNAMTSVDVPMVSQISENLPTADADTWMFTLSPIIMEVESRPKWKESNMRGTYFPLPWSWEEGYFGQGLTYRWLTWLICDLWKVIKVDFVSRL